MKYTPLNDNVIIKQVMDEKDNEGLEGDLEMAPTAKDAKRSPQGIIESCGPGRLVDGKHQPMPVKEGDKVVFAMNKSIPIVANGEHRVMTSAREILCIIEK